jgi:Ser/Thr protein kinase RdoA (MazF antagonist)
VPLPFADLTLRGRARRLRALAHAALLRYPLVPRRLRLLSNGWNCVFRLDTDRGPHVLRITLPGHGHTPASVRSEATYLAALAETGLSVPRPVPSEDGALTVEASAPGVPEPRMVTIFRWLPGRPLGDSHEPEHWQAYGALHARLHAFGASWRPPEGFVAGDFDRVFHFPNPVGVWAEDLRGHEALFREAQAASDELIAAVRARDPVLLTHGDLHKWNVLLHRGRLHPIDFEDLMWVTAAQDLGTSLYYVSRRPDYAAVRDAVRAGYESVAPWPEGTPGEIDALRFARALDLLNVIAADRSDRVVDWPDFLGRIATLARGVVG